SPACDALAAGTALPEITQLPSIEDPADFNASSTSAPLAAGAALSVLAELHRDAQLTARGCLDGVQIIANQDTAVVIPVAPVTLGYQGTFSSHEIYDMAVLIPGGESEILTAVAEIGGGVGGSRGQAIVSLLCDYAELSAMTCTTIGLAAGYIDDVIEESVPPYVLEALTVFGDLYDIIRSMEIEGEILIAEDTPAEGLLPGNTHRLLKMGFTWREGCPHDTAEACTFTIEMDDAGLGLEEIPEGRFEGLILEDGRLQLGQHTLPLPMEHVALLIVESWLLPAYAGEPMTVQALIAALLPCEAIASLAFGLGEDTCRAYLSEALAELILEQVNAIAAGISEVTLEGIAVPLDADRDRRVEALIDGAWVGSMPGTFTACLLGAACAMP
ncbi:hypothetical protein KKF91_19060, partial [Myxococcota bacterium]|nr:hypothetical protein [Myxococcota bacterium]